MKGNTDMTDGQVVLLIAGTRLVALTLRAWADALDAEADRYEQVLRHEEAA